MKKILSFIGILGFTLAVSSCVSKKQFTDLQTNYTQLQTKHSALQEEYNGAKVKLAEYTSDSKSLAARLAEEQQRNKELKEAYAKLQGSYQSNVQQGNVDGVGEDCVEYLVPASDLGHHLDVTLGGQQRRQWFCRSQIHTLLHHLLRW